MKPEPFAVVLPARYHSTRFPGKPLALIAGKPLIEWVYLRAKEIQGVERVIIATDHDEIAMVARGFGGDVMLTSERHQTGTDRVAEVARSLDYGCIVNLQGDEPIFSPRLVEEMVGVLQGGDDIDIVTACHPIVDPGAVDNPHVVKVVMDRSNRALYFSRAPIPYGQHGPSRGGGKGADARRHIGIYVFRKSSLLRFADSPRSTLEILENLEQLRALENGMRIHVLTSDHRTLGVDVPEDIKTVEKALFTS
jgi:3-deoxy-manno-octulosonate cytidylyltransferase (CMP-KDO synthetase)